MRDTPTSDHLELITLNDTVVSFSRLFANTVRYHHWHQCLEILYVEEGFGVAIVDNRHYTMRPGRLFFFPPFTLHKVMVDAQAEAIYRRTIIHLDHHAVLKNLRDFRKPGSGWSGFHAAAVRRGSLTWRIVITMSIICWAVISRP